MAQGVTDLYGVDGLARMSTANPVPTQIIAGGTAVNLTDPAQVYVSNPYQRMLDSGLVKTGAGSLAGLTVAGAGTAITITIYDNTSAAGTIIFGPYTLIAGVSLTFGSTFGTGLYVAFSGTTGTPSLTVFYR